MTPVLTSYRENQSNVNRIYTIGIVTFDGETFTEEIEAKSAERAQTIAARMYPNADYIMVNGCCTL